MREPLAKNGYLVFVIFAVLGAVFSLAYVRRPSIVAQSDSLTLTREAPEASLAVSSVRIGDTDIAVELATTSIAIERGLSGRNALHPERGMLFVFPEPDRYRFWMPDMHFPIDIIWIEGGKVIAIDADVSPDFDPADTRFYLPPRPVRYVLEVNAGFVKRKRVAVGDAVAFHLEE